MNCKSCRVLSLISLTFVSLSSPALSFLSGPVFTPAANAPLAGRLQLATEVDSRVDVLVSDGFESWQRSFYDYATNHSTPLLGFKPGRTYTILVTVHDKIGNTLNAAAPLTLVTAPLPANFPHSTVLVSQPDKMEPGYTLFMIHAGLTGTAYLTIVDNAGDVVWYMPWTTQGDVDVRQLDNGNLFVPEPSPLNRFIEVNMLGETVQTWSPPAAYKINAHEGLWTPHGTILYLSDVTQVVTNFPGNDTDPNASRVTANIDDNPVVEISRTNGALLKVWSPLDMLDPTRVTYLTYEFRVSYGVDNEHANAIIEDPRDNSLIVSLRDQNAVFKFTRAGQLKWILGPPANWSEEFQPYLLAPVGTPFEWNYGQHAPQLTPAGTIMLFDDGIERASPYDPPINDPTNYSRAVEYAINETNLDVTQVWDTTLAEGDQLFTPVMGNADYLPQRRNVLVTYSWVTYVNGVHPSAHSPNATMVRIREYTHDPIPEIIFDLSFFDYANTSSSYTGYLAYRSHRIPDLYAHPAQPVGDLRISRDGALIVVQFSADPGHSYRLQSSRDLQNWNDLGAPSGTGESGEYEFVDLNSGQAGPHFYRIVTQ